MTEPAAPPTSALVDREAVVGGVLWSALQRWAARVTALITFVLLGRLLSPHEFGLVAFAALVVSLVNVVSEVGFSTYLVQARELDQRTISSVFWSGVLVSLALAGGLVVAAPLLADVLALPEMTRPLQALSLVIVLTSLSSTQTALLRRRLDFRAIAVRSIVATVVSCALAVGVALGGGGVWALVAQSLAFSGTSVLMLWSLGGWRPSLTFDPRIARTVAIYGSSILGIQLVAMLRNRGDQLVIGAITGPVVLAFYAVAGRIITVILDTAVSVISSVANPTFARVADDPRRLRHLYVMSVCTSLAVLAPVLLLMAATAPVAIPLVFGEKWEPSVIAAQLLAIAGLATTMVYFDRGLMIALDRRRYELTVGLVTTAVGLGLVACLASFGLTAVAAAAAARAALTWPVRLRTSCRALGMPIAAHAAALLRILAAAVAATAPAAALTVLADGIPRPGLIALAGASVVLLYPPLLWLLHRSLAMYLGRLLRSRLRR
jgi:O-antigen/teichoic acid export membrane protein